MSGTAANDGTFTLTPADRERRATRSRSTATDPAGNVNRGRADRHPRLGPAARVAQRVRLFDQPGEPAASDPADRHRRRSGRQAARRRAGHVHPEHPGHPDRHRRTRRPMRTAVRSSRRRSRAARPAAPAARPSWSRPTSSAGPRTRRRSRSRSRRQGSCQGSTAAPIAATIRAMPMWRCPHCGTPQAETARCWVCRRSSTACGTCRNFRRSVAGSLGYCGLDRRRQPLTGDEIRACWEARPGGADRRAAAASGTR